MTLTQMQYFKTVCQYMSLTKASQKLHISQPALSMAIKEMEDVCGVSLFHRTANSLSITDHGCVLLDEVTNIINQYEQMQLLLSNKLLNRNYVRIGLSTLSSNSVLPDIVAQYRKKHPDIHLIFTETETNQHYDKLDNNTVDLLITEKNPDITQKEWDESSSYRHIALTQSDVTFAVSRDNQLARKKEVTWSDIIREPLVMLNDTFTLTQTIKNEVREAGLELPQNIYYTSQMYTIEQFIGRNVASGFLPTQVVKQNPSIIGVNCPLPKHDWIYLVYRKDRRLFQSAMLFIQTVKEMYQVNANAC